jgi:hypothetical protein
VSKKSENVSENFLSTQGVAQRGAGVGPLLPRLVERDAQGVGDLPVARLAIS